MSKVKVLIVEDESMIAFLLKEFLEDIGDYEVVSKIPSVEKGLQAIRSLVFDIAILDVRLADGFSFPLAHLLQEKNIPFIFSTGSYSDIGATFPSVPVLEKPFKISKLEETLALVRPKSIA